MIHIASYFLRRSFQINASLNLIKVSLSKVGVQREERPQCRLVFKLEFSSFQRYYEARSASCTHTIFIIDVQTFTERVRSTTGRLCFDTCLSIHPSVCPWGEEGIPRYLPHCPRYLPPIQVRMGEGGTPRYLPPHTGYLPTHPGQDGGVPQGTYPPPGTGQHMKYFIRCGRYASCVHAGGLSCLSI